MIHVEVVFLVAMIAVGRHVIEIDYAHGDPGALFGTAAVILALTVGYYLLKKSAFFSVPRPGHDHETESQ